MAHYCTNPVRDRNGVVRRKRNERRRDHAADGIDTNRMLASIAAFSGEELVSVESCFNTEASPCRCVGGGGGAAAV